jgi:hypothetical protein
MSIRGWDAIEILFSYEEGIFLPLPVSINYSHNARYIININTTYEELVDLLILKAFLQSLHDQQLRYKLEFIIDRSYIPAPMVTSTIFPGEMREGQSLVSLLHSVLPLDRKDVPICHITKEKKSTLQKEKPDEASPSLSERFIAVLASQEVTAIVNAITIATTFITMVTFVAKQWSKERNTVSTSSQKHISQSTGTDFVAIRLRMTHGPDHEFEEWLTNPDRLKHYIDAFNQSSSSIQPLQATFVQRNGLVLKVDVIQGSENNLQLDELLSYLKINLGRKQDQNLAED